jgi:hypothetical protein
MSVARLESHLRINALRPEIVFIAGDGLNEELHADLERMAGRSGRSSHGMELPRPATMNIAGSNGACRPSEEESTSQDAARSSGRLLVVGRETREYPRRKRSRSPRFWPSDLSVGHLLDQPARPDSAAAADLSFGPYPCRQMISFSGSMEPSGTSATDTSGRQDGIYVVVRRESQIPTTRDDPDCPPEIVFLLEKEG